MLLQTASFIVLAIIAYVTAYSPARTGGHGEVDHGHHDRLDDVIDSHVQPDEHEEHHHNEGVGHDHHHHGEEENQEHHGHQKPVFEHDQHEKHGSHHGGRY